MFSSFDGKSEEMARVYVTVLVGLATAAQAAAFAPASSFVLNGLPMKLGCGRKGVTTPKMSLENMESASALIAAAGVPNVPFVDEVSGDATGLTSPLSHFGSVISLWLLFSLPVWSAAYKKAGGETPEWFGVSQVTTDAPGIGREAKYSPTYDGPSFSEGLSYVFSFLWKPPILVAWKPRTDLDRASMDPARETVVSSLYKGFGGALDKTAIYDEEDQLLILSDMETFPETELGKRREAIAMASGLYSGNPSFGKSLIEYSEETKKGKKDFGTVTISASELAALRAEASKTKTVAPKPAVAYTPAAAKPAAAKPAAPKVDLNAAARAAAAKAASVQAAAAQAAKKAAASNSGKSFPQVGLGTMPVPKIDGKKLNIPFFGKTQVVPPKK